jgi:uncharacterized protein (TIGR02271 family)
MKVQILTSFTALSAALLFTGCCGPKASKSTAYHSTTSATVADAGAPPPSSTTVTDQNDISMPLYSEELKVGKRDVESGSVKLRKTVKTETASQPIELRRETVTIDRQAFESAQRANNAGQPNDIGAAFQEKEIVIDVKREEAVVEVAPYISGRIVAQKRATTEKQNVDRQIRREVVEVIKQGDTQNIIVSEKVTQDSAVGAPTTNSGKQTGESQGTNPPQR